MLQNYNLNTNLFYMRCTKYHSALGCFCFFVFLAASTGLSAQKSAVSIVAGLTRMPYEFDGPTRYDQTAAFFLWDGTQQRIHYHLGADYNYAVAGHWQIKTGLRVAYSRVAQELDLHWPSENANGQYMPVYQNERLELQHLFLDVPLAVRYVFSDRKFAPFAEAGFVMGAYLTSGIKERIEDRVGEKWSRNGEVRPFSLAAQVSAGVQYRLSARQALFVQVQPRVQLVGVEKVSKNAGLGWGVEAGWRVQLRK